MLIGAFYLLAFLTGVFVVWHFGKKDYYNEERLIDIALFSTVISLLLARISFLLSPTGRVELSLLTHSNDILLSMLSILQVSAGNIWWIGVMAFFTTAIFLLYRWKWPLWPVLGLLTLGAGVTLLISELLVWYWSGLTAGGVVALTGLVLTGTMTYLYLFDGSIVVKNTWRNVKQWWSKKISRKTSLSDTNQEKDHQQVLPKNNKDI